MVSTEEELRELSEIQRRIQRRHAEDEAAIESEDER